MASTQTVLVAVYDDYATAQQAEQDLLKNGFTKDEIKVSSGSDSSTSTTEHEHEGGISGFFRNLFGGHADADTTESHEYAEAVRRGGSVITATVDDDRIDAATAILDRYNPVDFDQRVDSYRPEAVNGHSATKTTGDRTIPVVQEELKVGKRTVQGGGVRVYSRVTETPVNESVTLREEHARIERRPVDRPATEADFRNADEVFEVVESSEEAVIGKTARVVEEVVVGKDSSQRTQAVHDTVRRTDVQVERIPAEVDSDFRRDYETRYGTQSGAAYDTYAPAYDYGYELSSDPRYQGKNWNDIESNVRSDYDEKYPNSTWDRMSNAVRYGWDKATARR